MNTKTITLILLIIAVIGIAAQIFLPKYLDPATGRVSAFKPSPADDQTDTPTASTTPTAE